MKKELGGDNRIGRSGVANEKVSYEQAYITSKAIELIPHAENGCANCPETFGTTYTQPRRSKAIYR